MLTDAACRNAKCPSDKPRARFADSGNLYLEVAASGSKRWFWKYFSGGKEKRLALGTYPAVGLKDAREGRDAARKLHEAGTDPVQARKIESATLATKSANTFEAVARELHSIKAAGWSESHPCRQIRWKPQGDPNAACGCRAPLGLALHQQALRDRRRYDRASRVAVGNSQPAPDTLAEHLAVQAYQTDVVVVIGIGACEVVLRAGGVEELHGFSS